MKVFCEGKGPKDWDSKVNFVDENNVVLGYDLSQDCCEDAGWFIATRPYTDEVLAGGGKSVPEDIRVDPDSLDAYRFDPHYLHREQPDWTGCGGLAIFRIVGPRGSEAFIHIYNAHNGYYCHGFTFKAGDETLEDAL